MPASNTTMTQDLSFSWEKPSTSRTDELNSTFAESTRKAQTIEHRVNSKKTSQLFKKSAERRSKMVKLVDESTFYKKLLMVLQHLTRLVT